MWDKPGGKSSHFGGCLYTPQGCTQTSHVLVATHDLLDACCAAGMSHVT